MIRVETPKAQHLLNHWGRVSIFRETYQTGGILVEASLPDPKITLRCCLLAFGQPLGASLPPIDPKIAHLTVIEGLIEASKISERL